MADLLYIGPGPSLDAPGLVITDERCPDCEWPETIIHTYVDGRMTKGCAGCERERPVEATPDAVEES